MNNLCCFATFQKISSIIIYGLIAVIVCICLAKLLNSDGGKKFVFYIISAVIVIVGIVCSIYFFRDLTSRSYINGEIDIRNQFITQSFEYKSSSVTFYEVDENLGIYSFEKDLTIVENFNGETKKYKVVLNDYELYDSEITAGRVTSSLDFEFFDVENNLIVRAPLSIKVEFLNNKTKLSFYSIIYRKYLILEFKWLI